jgi:RND family efflux transporter MFP subunit
MNRPAALMCVAVVAVALGAFQLCRLPLAMAADPAAGGERHDCVVEPMMTVKLGSREPGTIATIHVRRGDIVKKNDVLAELDSELQKLAVDAARVRAANDLDMRTAKAKLSIARTEFARAQSLLATRATPQKKFDEAALDRELATIGYEAAQLQYKIAQIDLSQALERAERRIIRSPIAGVVTEVTMSPGEYVYDQSVLMTIAMLDPLKVEAFAPIADYPDVTVGSVASVEMDAPVNERRSATVVVVDRVFDAASGTFGVRLEMANPGYRLPGGLRCKVRFDREGGRTATTSGRGQVPGVPGPAAFPDKSR